MINGQESQIFGNVARQRLGRRSSCQKTRKSEHTYSRARPHSVPTLGVRVDSSYVYGLRQEGPAGGPSIVPQRRRRLPTPHSASVMARATISSLFTICAARDQMQPQGSPLCSTDQEAPAAEGAANSQEASSAESNVLGESNYRKSAAPAQDPRPSLGSCHPAITRRRRYTSTVG
jgi:hypothetical protein